MIAEQLVDVIRARGLQRGDRLPTEQELARQFGVGRTSVREGLQKLQTLGVIEVVKGRGAFVSGSATDDATAVFARWSAEQHLSIEDLLEVRFALESLAAAAAALRADAAAIAELERFHIDHIVAGRQQRIGEVAVSDEQFHEALIAASNNALAGKLYSFLIAELTDFRRKTLALPGAPERSAAGHAAILDAVRRRDPVGARAATLDHLWILYEEVEDAGSGAASDTLRVMMPRDAIG